MESVSQDIERLIVRRLDGALTVDEELQLDKELIRNPEAHRLFEDYARVDALASEALREVMSDAEEKAEVSALTSGPRWRGGHARSPRYHRGWWLVPGAVAAALLALMLSRPSPNQGVHRDGDIVPGGASRMVHRTPGLDTTMNPKSHLPPLTAARDHTFDLMRSVSQYPVIHRRTGREVFGVRGDNGAVYWFEVDRTRTIHRASTRQPRRNSGRL